MEEAIPDGRKASKPLADGGLSPYQGRNVSGPTAWLRFTSMAIVAKPSSRMRTTLAYKITGTW